MIKTPRPNFVAKNSHGHAKEYLKKLSTICARALTADRQPWARAWVSNLFKR
jgi:hypothetical protein